VPRFFFDTYDGDHLVPDETGLELDDLEAAKVEAQKALPDVAKEKLSDGHQRVFMVSVRDEAGQVLMRIGLALRVEYFSQAQGWPPAVSGAGSNPVVDNRGPQVVDAPTGKAPDA
jgi:hypothetical protein